MFRPIRGIKCISQEIVSESFALTQLQYMLLRYMLRGYTAGYLWLQRTYKISNLSNRLSAYSILMRLSFYLFFSCHVFFIIVVDVFYYLEYSFCQCFLVCSISCFLFLQWPHLTQTFDQPPTKLCAVFRAFKKITK